MPCDHEAMKPGPTRRDDISRAAIGLLVILWLLGTPVLLYLALTQLAWMPFTVQDPNSLLEEYAISAAIVAIAAPAAAAIIAGKTGRGGLAAFCGIGAVLSMLVVVLIVGGMQGSPGESGRVKSVHTEPPMVCTAPPERALEVPGC